MAENLDSNSLGSLNQASIPLSRPLGYDSARVARGAERARGFCYLDASIIVNEPGSRMGEWSV